jgi:hypothetical protein
MTSRPGQQKAIAGAAAIAATLCCAAPALAQGASQLFYERTVMSAADSRCRLFDRPTSSALQAGAAQARGAALRAGTTSKQLAEVQARATAKAYGVACNSSDLATAAARVRTGFAGYARLQKMSYPGDTAGWAADRATSIRLNTWGLVQDTSFGRDALSFGIALGPAQAPSLTALASFADGAAPYAARIVARDPSRTADAYLDHRAAGPGGRLPLPARLPPASATQSFSAQTRSAAPQELLAANQKSGWMFRFSTQAADALAGLDPREAVAVDFLFAGRDGDSVRRAYVEVGDFAAGRAFLRAVEP